MREAGASSLQQSRFRGYRMDDVSINPKMAVPHNRKARGRGELPSSIPLQGMPRGRREDQSKMTVPHNKDAQGASIPSTPR